MYKVKKLFYEPFSYLHAFLGLLTYGLLHYYPIVSLVIFLIFIVYEAIEKEEKYETVTNIVEYFTGVWLGVIIFEAISKFCA